MVTGQCSKGNRLRRTERERARVNKRKGTGIIEQCNLRWYRERRTVVDFGCFVIRSFKIAFQIGPARFVYAICVAESVVRWHQERRRRQTGAAIAGSQSYTRRTVQVWVVIGIVVTAYAADPVPVIDR